MASCNAGLLAVTADDVVCAAPPAPARKPAAFPPVPSALLLSPHPDPTSITSGDLNHSTAASTSTLLGQALSTRVSWNHGRIVGPKPPLKPKHIWATRTRLQHNGRVRDLAMINVASDSKLRGCDLVRLRVADIHLGDSVRLRTTVVQQKTGRPVPFELTEPTREALAA